MKKVLLLVAVCILGFAQQLSAQCSTRPIINSFTPNTGFIGSTVTIFGANFDASNPANNVVYFGATKAQVTSASFGQLQVIVPVGASTDRISVTNQCKLTAYSSVPFNGIFCPTPLSSTTYNAFAQELSVSYGAYNMVAVDLDLDGKAEVLSAENNGGLSVAYNKSTPGNISFSAYNFASYGGQSIYTADFDGDGKKDILTRFHVALNTSTGNLPNPISFGTRVSTNSISDYQVAAGDFNNDGKIDIVGEESNNIYVARNLSTGPGNVSFSGRQLIQNVGDNVTGIQTADLDGDGKIDIIMTQRFSNRALTFRNTTPDGATTFSFEAFESWDVGGTQPYRCQIADFNKDGKMDFTTCNYENTFNTCVLINTSTPGDIVMNTRLNLASFDGNYRIQVGDVDGDGYPDIVTKSLKGNVFGVWRNTTTSPTNVSFANRIDYTSSNRAEVSGIVIGDLDGDFVPDIATSGIDSRTIRFHRNTSSQVDTQDPTAICKNFTLALSPSGTATLLPSNINDGSSDACGIASLLINKPGGTPSSSLTYSCADIGNNTVTLTVTDNAGNTATCNATVSVAPAAIIVSGQTTVCAGQTVTMNANQGDSYQWKKDGVNIPGATVQSYNATTSGAYSVSVTNAGGCSGTSAPVNVVVNNNPVVSVFPTGTVALCGGQQVLTASQSSIYQWKRNGVNIANATLQTYTATQTGTYTVEVVDLFGCSAVSDPINVVAATAPVANVQNVTVQLDANGFASIATSDTIAFFSETFATDAAASPTTTLNNWNVLTGDIDLADFVSSIPGKEFDLEGFDNAVVESKSGFNFTPGTYVLRFQYANNNAGTGNSFEVDLGSFVNQTLGSPSSAASAEFVFTVSANSTAKLRFTQLGPNDASGTFIGNISLSKVYANSFTVNNGSTASCGISSFSVSKSTFDCSNLGNNTVSFTVTDQANNSQSANAIVTVQDLIPPSFSVQNATVQLDQNGQGSLTINDLVTSSSDNCGSVNLQANKLTFDCSEVGQNTVTITANDPAGNIVQQTAVVTVLDVLPIAATDDAFNLNNCGASVTFSDADLLGNDNDPYNQTLKIDFVGNASAGTLVDNGNGTYTYTAPAGQTGSFTADYIVKRDDGTIVFSGNGHFYEYVSAPGISWTSAKAGAEARTYNGQQGYLVTITSAAENAFAFSKLQGQAWMGASDNETERTWKWVTGPEAGTVFYNQTLQQAVNGAYTNWQGGEPNDFGTGEDYAHFRASGQWNDFPLVAGEIMGYIVEYGGLAGDCNNSGSSDNGQITFNVTDQVNPTVITQDITVYLDGSGQASIVPSDVDNGSSDACGIANLSLDQSSFDCSDVSAEQAAEYAIRVDGVNDYIDLGNFGGALVQANQATAQVWLNPWQVPTGSQIQSLFEANVNGVDYFSIETNGPKISFFVTGSAITTAQDVLQTNQWINLTAVYDGTQPNASDRLKIYINGQLASIGSSFGTPPTTSGNLPDFYLGSQGGNSQFAKVIYDEVRVWDRALSASEVSANWDKTLVGNENGLIAYYSFEDGPGSTTVTELSGTQSLAQLTNMDPNSVWVTGANGLSQGGTGVQVNLTATDASGNSNSGSALVTVLDTVSPTMVTNSINVDLTSRNPQTLTQAQIDQLGALSSDNCAVSFSITGGQTTYDCSNRGQSFTLTLLGIDPSGNSASVPVMVTITDQNSVCNDPPVALCQNITVNTDGSTCTASITPAQVDGGSSDPDGDQLTYSLSNSGPFGVGTHTVTLSVSDGEYTETCQATVTVVDATNPVALAQNITVQLDANGAASIAAADVDNGSNDACGIASLIVSPSTFGCANVGTNAVTLTVTDNNGNVSTATAVVTVEDNVNPVALAQNITVQLDANGNTSITAADVDNGSNDACGIATLDVQPSSFNCSNVGANTVTLTVTDVNGNVSTTTAVVTVEDNVAPVALTQNITVQLDANGNTSITAADVDNGSNDACGIATLDVQPSSFDCSDVGANTVTLTVTDVNGNVSTATAVVTVEDNVAPIAQAQNLTVQLDINGQGSITASGSHVQVGAVAGNLANQNSGGTPTQACDCPSGYVAVGYEGFAGCILDNFRLICKEVNSDGTLGPNTVTTSFSGGGTSTPFTTSLSGNEALVGFTVQDGNFQFQGGRTHLSVQGFGKSISDILSGSDNSVGNTAMTGMNGAGCYTSAIAGSTQYAPAGHVIVGMDARVSGYSSVVSFKYAPLTEIATGLDAGSSDACGIASITASQLNFTCSDVGNNPVTLTVTDVNGNVSTAVGIVTVEDNVAPVAIAQDITVQLDASGNATITGADVDNGSNDACGIATVEVQPSTFNCSDVNVSNTQIITSGEWTMSSFKDTITSHCWPWPGSASQPAAATYTLPVSIGQPYAWTTIVPVGNAQVINVDNHVSFLRKEFNLSSLQDVAMQLQARYDDDVEIFINGHLIAADKSFDAASYNSVPRSVNWETNGSVVNAANGGSAFDTVSTAALSSILQLGTNEIVVALRNNPAAGDRGGISLFINIQTASAANPVTLTVTDVNGNVSTASAVVRVEDNVAPVAIAQDITVQLDANGNASITAADVNNGSNDACGIASLSVSPSTFNCSNVGANTVTLTVTDNNGNVSTATAIVTVEDNVAPVALTQNITVQLDASGNTSITAADVDNGSNDACGIATLDVQPSAFNCSNVGANTVTLTVTDVNGNVSTATAVVTVEDNVAPVALTQNITMQLDASGNTAITAADVDNGSNDACGIATLDVQPSTFNCSNVGANTVTLTVTDVNGNVSTATAVVTVEDNVAPVALTQNITVQLDASGNTSITAADVDNGSNDACGVASLSVSPSTFNCSNVGANTVTLTVTDVNGNVSTATAVVTVEDNVAPIAIAQDISISLDRNDFASISAADIDNGSNDACGIASLSVSPSSFGCNELGANTVVLTVIDVNGNISHDTAIVSVSQGNFLEITQQADFNLACNNAQGGAQVHWDEPLVRAFASCSVDTCIASDNIPGFEFMGEYNGKRYFRSLSDKHTWDEAVAMANAAGGHLAVITSAQENHWISCRLSSNYAWIGLTDELIEGQFEWVNGEALSYTNWWINEPNNSGGRRCHPDFGANYTVIKRWNGRWKDRRGCEKNEFIMEMPCGNDVKIEQIAGPASGSFFAANSSTVVTYVATDSINGATDTMSFTVTVDSCFVQYCTAQGNSTQYEWIQRVELENLNNNSGNNNGYGDFSNMTANLVAGDRVTISITPGFANHSFKEYWTVFIDWNADGDFNDWGELVAVEKGHGTEHSSFRVPSWAATGKLRMRVVMSWCHYRSACSTFSYGEVEDYTIRVTGQGLCKTNIDPIDVNMPGQTNAGVEMVELYPNPVIKGQNATLVVRAMKDRATELNIHDISGRLIHNQKVQLEEGENRITLKSADLQPGIYLIQLEGVEDEVQRFIITR